jgi:hypothetical protein
MSPIARLVLLALVVAIDVWRVIGATGDEADRPGPGDA